MDTRPLVERPTWTVLATASIIALATTAIAVRGDIRDLAAGQQVVAKSLTRQLAYASHLALLTDDRQRLDELAGDLLAAHEFIGSVQVYAASHKQIAAFSKPGEAAGLAARSATQIAQMLAGASPGQGFSAAIPPGREVLPIDAAGDEAGDSGWAEVRLSQARWSAAVTGLLAQNARLGLFVFCGLALTGFLAVWTMRRPLVRLAERVQHLTGTKSRPAHSELEQSLTAIGERLTHSETRAREAAETLRSARSAARLRADILAGMSHELRAPLSAIVGHTEIMTGARLDAEQREHVAIIRKSAGNLLSVIDNVLEWGGLEAGRANFDEVGFDLGETIEDTIALLAPAAFDKKLELGVIIYQDVPLRLRGDPLRFQQILTNLVSNAIKFTDQGSVVVRAMREDEAWDSVCLRVSVADTGPGIDPAQRHRLFGMYERLHRPADGSGSGLGLAISQRLLEMMGGEIDVHSVPGEGAEFYFLLPLRKAFDREQPQPPWPGLRQKRVWLTEAFPAARDALRQHLEAWQTRTVVIDAYTELRATLEAERPLLPAPDVLIIGLHADRIDDADIAAILASARQAAIPTLTLVNSVDSELHAGLAKAGAGRSLAKSLHRLRLYRELCELTGASAEQTQSPLLPLTGVAALVADDDAGSRRYLAALLTELGARVTSVADGDTAIDACRQGDYALALLDERMPGKDGIATAQALRALIGNKLIIVGATADSDGEAGTRFRAAGADACLSKPFDSAVLEQRVVPLVSGAPKSPAKAASASERLTSDPEMAALLACELPGQVEAVKAAVAEGDRPGCRAVAHTLHGTAAFYGLSGLQTEAAALEECLAAGETPSNEALTRLTDAAESALATLERRAGQRAAGT